MRPRGVLIGAVLVMALDLALVFTLFGMHGDPPDAFVIVATAVFWTAALVAVISGLLTLRQYRSARRAKPR
ncbi:MAG: hypothetical protein M3P37_14080 [Actinomycetota bacterium]|nr:hypothetical protein [Actinomycetota bacterium]